MSHVEWDTDAAKGAAAAPDAEESSLQTKEGEAVADDSLSSDNNAAENVFKEQSLMLHAEEAEGTCKEAEAHVENVAPERKSKAVRKRKAIASSSEEEEQTAASSVAPELDGGSGSQSSSDEDSEEERRRRRRLKKRKERKKRKREKREKKKRKKQKQEKEEEEAHAVLDFDRLSENEKGEEDDDEMSSDGADMVDDENDPVYAEGVSHSGDSEPEYGDELSSNETGLKVAPRSPSSAAAAAAQQELAMVDFPADVDAEFNSYMIPISYNGASKEMFCAVLFHVAPCNVDELRTNMQMQMGLEEGKSPHYSKLEQAWKKRIYDPERRVEEQHAHPCNSAQGALWHALKDDYEIEAGLEEQDWDEFNLSLKLARRQPGSRLSPINQKRQPVRRWLYCVISGEDVYHMRSTVGAYRLRLRFEQSMVPGLSGGDFAEAAVDSAREPLNGKETQPRTLLQMRDLAQRSLCLISAFETPLHEFNEAERSTFVRRVSDAKTVQESGIDTQCFAGFPIYACIAARFQLQGAVFGDEQKIKYCCPIPKPFLSTMSVPRLSNRATGNGVQSEFTLRKKSVSSNTQVYNAAYARALMITRSFDPAFFHKYRTGVSSVNARLNRKDDDTRKAVCFRQWSGSSDILALCMAENSGKEYVNRVSRYISEAFQAAAGRKERTTCLSLVLMRRALRRFREHYEAVEIEFGKGSALAFIYGREKAKTKDSELLVTLSRFLRWFGDAFLADDPLHVMGTQALGLGLVNKLRDDVPHAYKLLLNIHLKDESVPYVALFDELLIKVRHLARRHLRKTFLDWLAQRRRAKCWEVLRKKLSHGDDADALVSDEHLKGILYEIFSNVMNALGPLQAARQAGERCVPVYRSRNAAFGSGTVSAADYVAVVNVESSPVRVVCAANGQDCALVHVLDYEVERSLRAVVLNEAHVMQAYDGEESTVGSSSVEVPPVLEDSDARVVLLRSDDSDTLLRLLQEELIGDIRNATTYKHKLLAIAHDARQLEVMRDALKELYDDSSLYQALTLDEFLKIGPRRTSLLQKKESDDTRWGKFATQLFVYNAHRFAYDEMLMLTACAAGVHGYGPENFEFLRKVTQADRKSFDRRYAVHNHEAALDSDFELFLRRREKKYIEQVREIAERFGDDHINSDPKSHWSRGKRVRWIFSGIAYQRTSPNNTAKAPPGNFFEDLYFSNVANNERVRVSEEYSGIADQLVLYKSKGRLLFLSEKDMATPKARKEAIVAAKVNYMKNFESDVVARKRQQDMAAARKRAMMDKRSNGNVQQSLKKFAPIAAAVSSAQTTVRVTYPTWVDFSTLLYAPNWCADSTNLHRVTQAPRKAVDSHTQYAKLHHKPVHCDLFFIDSESVLGSAPKSAGFELAETLQSRRAGLHNAPDICGVGRWFVLEILARLRSQTSGCVIVCDTYDNFTRIVLAPNVRRKTCVPWLYQDVELRKDQVVAKDEQYYQSQLTKFAEGEIENRAYNGYAACLQSTSVMLWREDDAEIIRQMNESESEEQQVQKMEVDDDEAAQSAK